jgi:hypothetical protein
VCALCTFTVNCSLLKCPEPIEPNQWPLLLDLLLLGAGSLSPRDFSRPLFPHILVNTPKACKLGCWCAVFIINWREIENLLVLGAVGMAMHGKASEKCTK